MLKHSRFWRHFSIKLWRIPKRWRPLLKHRQLTGYFYLELKMDFLEQRPCAYFYAGRMLSNCLVIWYGESGQDYPACKFYDVFVAIGIPKNHIAYAYNNPMEFIAVASEGDLSKCSPEFKQALIDFGMPEWEFDLK